MKKIQELALAMINYDNGDPKRIQHTTKVHAYASLIGIGEGLDEETQFILESAALVHDIALVMQKPSNADYIEGKRSYIDITLEIRK